MLHFIYTNTSKTDSISVKANKWSRKETSSGILLENENKSLPKCSILWRHCSWIYYLTSYSILLFIQENRLCIKCISEKKRIHISNQLTSSWLSHFHSMLLIYHSLWSCDDGTKSYRWHLESFILFHFINFENFINLLIYSFKSFFKIKGKIFI